MSGGTNPNVATTDERERNPWRRKAFLFVPTLVFVLLAGGFAVFRQPILVRWHVHGLVRAARAGDAAGVGAAAERLAENGPSALPLLASLFSDPDARVREAAFQAAMGFGASGTAGLPRLVKPGDLARFHAWNLARTARVGEDREKGEKPALAKIRQTLVRLGAPAAPALAELVADENPAVAGQALEPLERLGPKGRAAAEKISGKLPRGKPSPAGGD